jgi:uncharacterized protein (DUF4415 family)
MTRQEKVSQARPAGRRSVGRTTPARPSGRKRSRSGNRTGGRTRAVRVRRSRPLGLSASAKARKRTQLAVANPELYRPLKKPITLRIDADVLAWFKKEGRRYQTRINQALRKVMEREMKGIEK